MYFNSQPHEEADGLPLLTDLPVSVFQLTASRGGWQPLFVFISIPQIFQLTASRGGWLSAFMPRMIDDIFQLTASRGGWPCSLRVDVLASYISTHSLTRRLTKKQQKHVDRVRYFNSQPHEEADLLKQVRLIYFRYFNSQPHEEADMILPGIRNNPNHFNSQPHEEADTFLSFILFYLNHFNSQPHEEADVVTEWVR